MHPLLAPLLFCFAAACCELVLCLYAACCCRLVVSVLISVCFAAVRCCAFVVITRSGLGLLAARANSGYVLGIRCLLWCACLWLFGWFAILGCLLLSCWIYYCFYVRVTVLLLLLSYVCSVFVCAPVLLLLCLCCCCCTELVVYSARAVVCVCVVWVLIVGVGCSCCFVMFLLLFQRLGLLCGWCVTCLLGCILSSLYLCAACLLDVVCLMFRSCCIGCLIFSSVYAFTVVFLCLYVVVCIGSGLL